jgi:endoglucanase
MMKRKTILQGLGVIVLFLAAVLTVGTMQVYAATAVESYGALQVSGTKLVSQKTGEEVQLRGVSTHGINWDVGYPYISEKSFKTLRDSYGVNAIRLAMYTTEYYGYCDKGSASDSKSTVQSTLKKRVDDGVQAATKLGMYVIIDWHVLNDQTPLTYKKEAKTFFKEMSKKYKDYDNVIYEICNEPNGGTTWSDIKKYAKEVIPVIRENDSDAVIIVGTPTWSQDVDVAAASPLDYDNIMYTMHFYAATHGSSYRDKLQTALDKGLPVMVTEFGVSEASGDGKLNKSEAEKWLKMLDKNKISYFAWSLSNKAESSALLKSSTNKKSGWKTSDLSSAGKWVLGRYQKQSGISSSKPAQVKSVSLKNQKNRKIKVSYKKVSGVTGYEIQYSTSKKFAAKSTKNVKTQKTSYTLKNLKKGKTYYVRVRAYKTKSGTTVKGSFSSKKNIKVKG